MRAAAGHALGESCDPVWVLSLQPEVLAGDVPVGALAGAGGLDVGGLFGGLPSAGEDHCSLDGRALLAVDVLGVGEAYRLEVLGGELDVAV